MKFELNLAKTKLVSICISVCILASACTSTIIPKTVKAEGPSFSGNVRNSGIVQFDPDGGVVIDAPTHLRYNALIAAYGGLFSPALVNDDGVKQLDASSFWIDDAHLAKAVQMNEWRKSGKAPVKKGIIQTIKAAM